MSPKLRVCSILDLHHFSSVPAQWRWLTLRTLVKMLASEPGNHNSGGEGAGLSINSLSKRCVFLCLWDQYVITSMTHLQVVFSYEAKSPEICNKRSDNSRITMLINKKVMTYKMTMQRLINKVVMINNNDDDEPWKSRVFGSSVYLEPASQHLDDNQYLRINTILENLRLRQLTIFFMSRLY